MRSTYPWGQRPTRALKPFTQQKPKNPLHAAQNRLAAIDAGQNALCLSMTYEGLHRIVEVHTVGITTAGRPAMRAFQVEGQSNSGPVPDWRMFCFDECFNVTLTNLKSLAPRPDYKKRDKGFRVIDFEV